ncbi:uncharacterized protein LOC141601362 [Silene latifolia]|uniref:uncharacterized protein LOC141601362 n=1 Tax=Silene latifolia TaxID=37657 RepID=UPI003D786DA3
MEKNFSLYDVQDRDKVKLASHFLVKEADRWWTITGPSVTQDPTFDWNRFKTLVETRFYPKELKQQKLKEFIDFKQGGLSVQAFTDKFNDLAHYAPKFVKDEDERVYFYRSKLNPKLESMVRRDSTTFVAVYDDALWAENSLKAIDDDAKTRSHSTSYRPNFHGKRPFVPSPSPNYANKRFVPRTQEPKVQEPRRQEPSGQVSQSSNNNLNLEKARKVSFLGHVISKEGVMVDPSKIEAVMEWKSPTNVGKANVVADALSRKSIHSLSAIRVLPDDLCAEFRKLSLQIVESGFDYLGAMVAEPVILRDIRDNLVDDATFKRFQANWEKSLPLVEFSYNNSYHASIKMAPYEALYGRKCRSPICWNQASDVRDLGPDKLAETIDQVKIIRERMKAAQDRQKSYADIHRRPLEFEIGDKVFLKVSPMKGVKRFGVKGKLSPKYIGPYDVEVH